MLLLMVGALMSAQARPTDITTTDVREMTRKIETAQRVFESVWSRIFASSGSSYESPDLVAYTDPIRTPCGRMWSGNAGYCPVTNTIYYDPIFLTRLVEIVGTRLGTDGDYAAVLALAHEWGHAVAIQMGVQYRLGVLNEEIADRLAGAVTRAVEQAGYLDTGDLDEARFTLSILGDHDGVMITDAGAHGDSETRVRQFMRGYEEGAEESAKKLRAAGADAASYRGLGRGWHARG